MVSWWTSGVRLGLVRSAPFCFLLSLAGCPGGADLEQPERFLPYLGTGGSSSAGGGGTNAGGSGGFFLDCMWEEGLRRNCATGSCHDATNAAGLRLVPDEGLIERVKDVPVTLTSIDCTPPGAAFTACEPPGPPECHQYVNAKLVDSMNPDASFILTKMGAAGCGNTMPLAPGNSASRGWSDERKQCLERWVRAVAALP